MVLNTLHATVTPQQAPLKLAVVGHTNTGKTSLLRTLLRDSTFGEVANAPATTRHVEGALLRLDELRLQWFDTPGMEDSIALLDYLELLAQQQPQRLDGPALIELFLRAPESRGRFEQEARVLRQLLASDAGLYVIDVRTPVRSKYRDELSILGRCGRPLIPVLNFLHAPTHYASDWKDTLARQGLHVIIEFDTVAPALDGEVVLYQKLALVLDSHRPLLEQLANATQQKRQQRRQQAHTLIAELLINIAALRRQSDSDEAAVSRVWQDMQRQVRAQEHQFIKDLLTLYRFDPKVYDEQHLPIEGERWAHDLFSAEALKDMGLHIGKGVAAGAMAGATVDLLTGGLSLGAGTVIGGLLGGVWRGGEKVGNRLLGILQGHRELTIDDTVLRLLALRGLSLSDALERRGHAAQDRIQPSSQATTVTETSATSNAATASSAHTSASAHSAPNDATTQSAHTAWREKALPAALTQARAYPQWSVLNPNYRDNAARQEAIHQLAKLLGDT